SADGGYGPVESSPSMVDGSSAKGSGSATTAQAAVPTPPPESHENAGRIQLVSGESPQPSQPKIPLPAARRKTPFAKGPAGSTTPLPGKAATREANSTAENLPGRARGSPGAVDFAKRFCRKRVTYNAFRLDLQGFVDTLDVARSIPCVWGRRVLRECYSPVQVLRGPWIVDPLDFLRPMGRS